MADETLPKPAIGRIVHYSLKGRRCPAIITFVHGDTCVNLTIFGPDGAIMDSTECTRGQHVPGDAYCNPDGSNDQNRTTMPDDTWCWPPRV